VIVRDAGESWQLVLQTDHADLAAGFARAWAERGPRHDSLVLAAERHDDGWAVWEASPLVDDEGAPVTFLDVQVPSHLAFYRAMIAAVSDEDAYAGLLVSMHGAGIYRHRYGEDPGLQLTHAPAEAELVEAFVEEQEAGFGARMTAADVDDDARWGDSAAGLARRSRHGGRHQSGSAVSRAGAAPPAGWWRSRCTDS
jgi:hypothetical protein